MCGMSASAQIDLGSVLNDITGGGSSSATDKLSDVASIFSSDKQASASKIVGNWSYSEPAIVFESNNLLTKAGAGIAANKIEDKMQEYLTKYGIAPGTLKITFAKNGTFTETMGKKTIKGKWAVKDSKLNITYGTKVIPITTQLSGKKLMFVTDATKLLDLIKLLSSKSSNSSMQTVSTLMKSINGMQAGVTFVKK